MKGWTTRQSYRQNDSKRKTNNKDETTEFSRLHDVQGMALPRGVALWRNTTYYE